MEYYRKSKQGIVQAVIDGNRFKQLDISGLGGGWYMYYVGSIPFEYSDVRHFGIKGQKWGIRRFQNSDGTLTEEGKNRYKYHRETIRQELGYGPNARKKVNTSEKHIVEQYRSAKQFRDTFTKGAQKAQDRGKLKRAEQYRSEGRQFAEQMLKLKNVADEYRNMGDDERNKINNWFIRKQLLNESIGVAMAVGTAYANPTGFGVGVVPQQDMRYFLDEYKRKHK